MPKQSKNEKPNEIFAGESESHQDLDVDVIRKLLEEIEDNVEKVKHLLFIENHKKTVNKLKFHNTDEGKIVEGVFDGEEMIASDGNRYPVPPNYASKSKLVSGDVLKLTIKTDGTFLFKQIGPVERMKLIGELKELNGKYVVFAKGKNYNVLSASLSYYKVSPEDKITIIVPKNAESDWAAIENIIDVNKKEN